MNSISPEVLETMVKMSKELFTVREVSGKYSLSSVPGVLLIDVLADAGLMPAESPCGRMGICNKCLVRIRSKNGWTEVLACQTRVESDVEVDCSTPGSVKSICLHESMGKRVKPAPALRKILVDSFSGGTGLCWEQFCSTLGFPAGQGKPIGVEIVRVVAEFYRNSTTFTAVVKGNEIIGAETGNTLHEFYGMAFDIGTTTVVGYLLSLHDGRLASTVSSLNPQVDYGADVITRITIAERRPDGLETLRRLIVGCVDELIGKAAKEAGIRRESIYDLVFVGNPCMQHLFLGIQPASLGKAPYQPVLRGPQSFNARQVGIGVNTIANVNWLPGVAGFVGSDTIGMIVAYSPVLEEKATLALDIGTNGEMVLASRGELWACSAAAGPAFEGRSMTCGMRAQPGAIDRVWIENGGVFYHVIGGVKPRGLCGSGIVEAVSALLKEGFIGETGRLNTPEERNSLRSRFFEKEGVPAFLIAADDETHDGRDIVISQSDIRELQLAKAALAAGAKILLSEAGLAVQDIQQVLLAGAFGLYLSPESIRAIGLLPDMLCDKTVPVGNAAGLGAQNALLSENVIQLAAAEAKRIHYVELAGRPDFSEVYIEELLFRNARLA